MKKYLLKIAAILCFIISINKANAQTNIFPSSGNAGIGTTSPLASAALEMKSTSEGLLIPRMTKVQRDAVLVSTAAKGLLIYQTDNTPGFYYYSGSAWTAVSIKSANTALSNLKTPTAVNVDILPKTNDSINIGSTILRYKNINLYNLNFSDGSIQTKAFIPYTAGTGISIGGTTITNAAPDKTVVLTAGTGISVTGTYPNFTINNTLPQGWSLTGNSATDSAVNFVGTKDAHPLLFRVNNIRAGYIGYAKSSTSFGYNALSAVTTGNYNTATGTYALAANTSGNNNTANGSYALVNNTTGGYNAAFGSDALHNNTSGSYNVIMGSSGLYSNTFGNSNTAEGFAALYSNTTGYSNVAIGVSSLSSNTTKNNLVAIGDSALYNNGQNATGLYEANDNTAVGSKALYSNSTGYYNTATGYEALYSNTNGTVNCAFGNFALHQNNSGSANIAVGNNNLEFNTDGSGNTALGNDALGGNIHGDNNTSIGNFSLGNNGTGNFNTALGAHADVTMSLLTNVTSIGSNTFGTASNQVRVGDNNVTSIGGYADWTNISDGRVKKNIKQNVPGLAFINKLQPITYNLNLDAADKIIQRPVIKDKNGKAIEPVQFEVDTRKAKEQIVYTGFVAQDVEKVAKSLNYDFSGVDAAKNDKDLYGLRYADFVVPLVKAVQELSKMNDAKDASIDSLKNQNNTQQTQIDILQNQINELKAMIVSNQPLVINQQSTVISSSSLQQNIPNPFTHSTTIGYLLPQKFTNAQIVITDKNGKTLKQVNISRSGKGSLNVDASTLSSGAYQYSLMIDGRLIATKQMILSR